MDAIPLVLRALAVGACEVAAFVENVSQGIDDMVSNSRKGGAAAPELQHLAPGLTALCGKFCTA
ncbi:MAG: hypothetical protein RBT81_12065 [Gammaproteobacteria bacterium]|jgi:hypothetical protein|nr:hypothetical protein [Gammaproteobacteria bacterium]